MQIQEVRCSSCGRLIGRTDASRVTRTYCLDPICPYLPALGQHDTRDSAISTMSAMGWLATHLADVFTISRQRVIQVVQERDLTGNRREAQHGAA